MPDRPIKRYQRREERIGGGGEVHFFSFLVSSARNVDRSTVTVNVLDRRKGLHETPITIEKWVNRRFHFFALHPLSPSPSIPLSLSRSLLDEFIIGLVFNFEEQLLLPLPLFRRSHEYSTRKMITEILHTLHRLVIYLDFVPGQVPTPVSQDVARTQGAIHIVELIVN